VDCGFRFRGDRGIGIPFEDQGRLFDNFFRSRNVGKIKGNGLGLAIRNLPKLREFEGKAPNPIPNWVFYFLVLKVSH
jgi:hypothetical protein